MTAPCPVHLSYRQLVRCDPGHIRYRDSLPVRRVHALGAWLLRRTDWYGVGVAPEVSRHLTSQRYKWAFYLKASNRPQNHQNRGPDLLGQCWVFVGLGIDLGIDRRVPTHSVEAKAN